ncbi:MAG: histidine phosphatase family protein [Gammaproteobacteria bacterium]|nr:histidine phosphatase family protein [Gammaproteobacteria bacterium]
MVEALQLPALSNTYYVMRHGQSLANTAGLIVSHPENGLDQYGLSDTGRNQVEASITTSRVGATSRIISSDFMRARETAEIVHARLACTHQIFFEPRLRERFFGELELGPDNRYEDIWLLDRQDSQHNQHGVESVNSVIQRASAVILECEAQFTAATCLLIAHGDILQILQTAFFAISPALHRDLPHLETAEVRQLVQT